MKFCPRCGTPVKGNEKFCTKCGYPLKGQTAKVNSGQTSGTASREDSAKSQKAVPNERQSINYQQNWQQANQTLNKAKRYSNGYFSWLFSTLKNPTEVDSNVHPYYGITSIIAGMLLMFLSFYNIINNISSIFNNFINRFGGDDPDINDISTVIDKFKGSSIKDAILLCVVSFVIYWLAGFLSRKFTANQSLNVFQYSNQLATFTNATLVCEIIVFVLTLLSAYILSFYIIILTFVIYNVGLVYSIVRRSNAASSIYAAVIASCCTPIAVFLVIKYLVHSFIMNSIF